MADDFKDNNTKTIEKEEKNKQVKESNAKTFKNISYIGKYGINFFSLILVILISVTLIRFLYNGNGDIVSFRSLLDLLQNAPQVSTTIKNFVMQIGFTEEWAILDGLRIITNYLLDFWSIIIWLFSSIIDVAIFIVYFLAWVFV